jgi:hypothetical protein
MNGLFLSLFVFFVPVFSLLIHFGQKKKKTKLLQANSDNMIATIRAELEEEGSTRDDLYPFFEMNYVFIPANQPYVDISFEVYEDESDPCTFRFVSLSSLLSLLTRNTFSSVSNS